MLISDLDTPSLLVDLDIVERNLRRVVEYADSRYLRVRPHTKTHKTPALAKLQLEIGAAGLSVAKVSEAEVMLRAEPPDLLLAYPIYGKHKLKRLVYVARFAPLTVSVDSLEVAEPISAAAGEAGVEIGLMAEFDVGQNRVGVDVGEPLRNLVEAIRKLPHTRWMGISFYPGHVKNLTDHEGKQAFETVIAKVREAVEDLQQNGHIPPIVSGGSTPTLFESHRIPYLNEIRPGTYIFNDRNCVAQGVAEWRDCAASILVTVVSTARPDQLIVDGGSKTFFSDRMALHDDGCWGRVMEAPEARFHKMNEEHGFIQLPDAAERFPVGSRLRIIPNHICVAVNLHERLYPFRGETVESVWDIEARGKLQ